MSDSTNSITKPVILPYKQSIFDRLSAVARSCLYVDRKSITCLKLRANFLLVGPTSTVKTFLARALAEEMKVPYLSESISDWLLLGSTNRGGSCTWPVIFDFLVSQVTNIRAPMLLAVAGDLNTACAKEFYHPRIKIGGHWMVCHGAVEHWVMREEARVALRGNQEPMWL